MKPHPTPFRTFFEAFFGICDIYVNPRGHVTGQIRLFWFAPREINFPAESTISSKFIPLAHYTPPAIVTHIHYVLPTSQPQQDCNTPTVHIPIRPRAPCS